MMMRWWKTLGIVIIIISVLCAFVLSIITFIYVGKDDIDFQNALDNARMKDIYEGVSGYISFFDWKKNGYSTGYGEITWKGMKAIKDLCDQHEITAFYDMGCGVGKSIVMAKLLGFETAIGVEIEDKRAKLAQSVVQNTQLLNAKIVHGDMMDIKIAKDIKVCIFASNLLWSQNVNDIFFLKLKNECQDGSIIVCSDYKAIKDDGYKHLEYLSKMSTPMSWDPYATCYIIKITNT